MEKYPERKETTMSSKANAKLADKSFAAARRKYYGGGVKELIRRAVDRTKETIAICSKPSSDPASEASKAIATMLIEKRACLRTLEIVSEALHGNKAMLRHLGSN